MSEPFDYSESPWLDPDAEPFIRIRGLSKNFGVFCAVKSVDLDIYKGEIFCLLGSSGCGKSTLLRMLAGFETPSSGSIEIDGVEMIDVPAYERPVNMMFQSYALFPHMNVAKNVAYGLKMDGVNKVEISSRVEEMLAMVELTEFRNRKPNQLSGGQRQRVALARALIKRPKVLLLDEPLAALDKRLREQTQFELINIQEQLGVTFIVVTHDQEEAMTLSSRIAVMDNGQFMQTGTPTEIYEHPKTRMVADFIGSANIFEGRVISNDNSQIMVRLVDDELEFLVDHPVTLAENSRVWLALRPEKIHLSKTAPPNTPYTQLSGKVQDLGYLGSMSIYRIKLASGRVISVTSPNQSRPKNGRHTVTWEGEVYLHWQTSSPVVLTS